MQNSFLARIFIFLATIIDANIMGKSPNDFIKLKYMPRSNNSALKVKDTIRIIAGRYLGEILTNRQDSARPPSSGYIGNRFTRNWINAQAPKIGALLISKANNKLPKGPDIAQANSCRFSVISASMATPFAVKFTRKTLPPVNKITM